MTWLEQVAAVYEGGREDRCAYEHGTHALRTLRVDLSTHELGDCPRAVGDFLFQVFDAGAYQENAYCTGDDELSRSLLSQGTWEPWETALALQLLRDPTPGCVLDIGSHVGWYSILAALAGRDVLAFDAETEHLAVLAATAAMNGVGERVTTARGWLGAHRRPRLPVGDRVRFAKIDVEGQEGSAAFTLAPLLDLGLVDYALVELSPEFGTGWEAAVTVFTTFGYQACLVPTKGDDIAAFQADPLGVTLTRPLPGELTEQRTALFVAP